LILPRNYLLVSTPARAVRGANGAAAATYCAYDNGISATVAFFIVHKRIRLCSLFLIGVLTFN
jgi:hypothetical protein